MPWETRKVRYAEENGKHEKSGRRGLSSRLSKPDQRKEVVGNGY